MEKSASTNEKKSGDLSRTSPTLLHVVGLAVRLFMLCRLVPITCSDW